MNRQSRVAWPPPTCWRTIPARAYVIVGGRHQFFPKRELDTIEYSIEDTYRGLYQELRGYLGKPGRHRGRVIAPAGEELTYARYGLYNYVPTEKQRREPY